MSSLSPISLPRRALIVSTPYARANGYTDAMSIVACDVLSVRDGIAECRVRTGSTVRTEHHPIDALASTPERAAAKVNAHFVALLSRPLLQNVAGKTESSAAAISV